MGKLENYLERMTGNAFRMLCDRYKNIAVQLFIWKNLPEGISSEILEDMLYEKGKVVCLKSRVKVNGVEMPTPLIFLSVTGEYDFNIYEIPQRISAGKKDANVNNLKIDDCVIVRNNYLKLPSRQVVEFYCQKMNNIDMAKDMNINASKTPFILKAENQKQLLSYQNFFKSIACTDPLIVVDSNFRINGDSELVINTGVELKLEQYQKAYIDYKNELLTLFGINNLETEKKERLLTDEIDSNNELIESFIISSLKWRKTACEEINKKWGTNISVDYYRKDLEEPKQNKEIINEGDEENGEQIHDNPAGNDRSSNTDI